MLVPNLSTRHQHLDRFRTLFNRLSAKIPIDVPLAKITAVGAWYNSETGLGLRDQFWLGYSLKYFNAANIPLASNVTFTSLNGPDQDFLDPATAHSTDVLLACMIIRPGTKSLNKNGNELDPLLLEKVKDHPALWTSPHHAKEAWREAAKKVGARLIVTFSYMGEIQGVDFEGSGYKKQFTGKVRGPTPQGELASFRMEVVAREDLARDLKDRGSFQVSPVL